MKKIALLLLVIAGLYACGSVPITGRRQLSLVSDQEVLSLSLQSYNEYIQTAQKSTDKNATALVVKVGTNIAKAVESYFQVTGQEDLLSQFQWEFNLINENQVNAFCMPGGKIVVYEGILPYTQTEAGLAVVLGHEVGHAIAKHSNERMSNQMALEMGGAAVSSVLSKTSATTQNIGATVWGLGSELGIALPFNRKQELEADHLGLVLMAIAGYDPNAAIPFWERMSQQGGGTPEFLSTHPSDHTRVSEIRKKLPEAMEYYNSIWGTNSTGGSAKPNAKTDEQWRF